ncbi:hypothetical protein evm_010153 [Chilo suppressalis]|nr:hypothetical protein evm_010153 [Chilo suppressalis]
MLLSNDNSQLSHKIIVNGRNQVEIEAADKTVLTVPEHNFHSFTRNYVGEAIFCKLCALPFVDENSHKMTPEHMRRVMAPIEDMHGIRQGRNSTTAHCILCNTSLITKEGHIASFIHKNSLTAFSLNTVTKDPNSIVTAQPKATQAKTRTTYCQPCDRLIHTNNFDAHTKGAIHKTNVKTEIDRKSNETDNNINKANVIVPTSSLNTVTEEQNSKVTAQSNAAQTKTGTTYCQPCDTHT